MASLPKDLKKVKVLVVGDSGVGKTSLVNLLVHGKVLSKSSWTIGCSVEVKVHEYKEGSPGHKPYFVELWDIGGNNSYKGARHLFYQSFHGVILVHDLTNRKSQQNLKQWLLEALLRENSDFKDPLVENFDAEAFGGFAKIYQTRQVPVLVVGTRLEQLAEVRSLVTLPVTNSIAQTCNAREIHVSCVDGRSLAPGSGNAVKVSRFLDSVIDFAELIDRGGGVTSTYPTFLKHRN